MRVSFTQKLVRNRTPYTLCVICEVAIRT